MRIIAGSLGGRQFESPKGHKTHPMSDKIRGALFNMLGDISDLTVLDPFAGSGAISFEAISRGAKTATAIELDKNAQLAISQNVKTLGLEKEVTLAASRAISWSRKNITRWFDLVICDPPYDKVQEAQIQKLTTHVARGGLMILSWPSHLNIPEFPGLTVIKDKSFGNARLIAYRKDASIKK